MERKLAFLAVDWKPVPGAIAYEVSFNRPPLQGVSVVVRLAPPLWVFDPSDQLIPLKVRPLVPGPVGAVAPLKPSAHRVCIPPPDVQMVNLEEYEGFDLERLAIPRFEIASYSVVKVLDDVLPVGLRLPKHALAVQVTLRRTAGDTVDASNVRKGVEFDVLTTEGTVNLDTRTLEPGRYVFTARALFKERWGKRITGPGLDVGDEETRKCWQEERRIGQSKESLWKISVRDITPLENIERLLGDVANRRTELSCLPLFIDVMLGYDCNLNCLHCDEGRVRRPARIPPGLIDEVCEYAVRGAFTIEVIGGEPLLYEETERIASVIEKHPHCCLQLATNGMLLNERWAERIAMGNYAIAVSLDGATQATFEAIRGKSNFKRIIDNLERIREVANKNNKKGILSVNFVVMRQNYFEIVDMVRLCAELGVGSLGFNLIENPGNLSELQACEVIHDKELCRKIRDLHRKAEAEAHRLGLSLLSRVLPRIFNHYPSLVETPKDARMLPPTLEQFLEARRGVSVVRSDLSFVEEQDLEEIYARIQELRRSQSASEAGPGRDEDAFFIENRIIPPLDPDFERHNQEGLTYLRGLTRGRLCDYPFTVLHLDTYRTYVCCSATDKFLYGHRYDSSTPTLYSIWNGSFMQAARYAMYTGNFDTVCATRCPYYAIGGTYRNFLTPMIKGTGVRTVSVL